MLYTVINNIFEFRKVFIGLSVTVLYITYYLVEVVKKPLLICGKGEFRKLLENEVPILQEYYWPTPWCVESRMQTVIGSLLRSYLMPAVHYRREILVLSDGGQVALDWLDAESDSAPTVLVLPGLTGASQADYARSLALAARRLGAHACVFNNRGLGGVPLTTPRLYCALSHDDLGEVVAHVARARPHQPVLACGVSLGGLILGQYLVARGERAQLLAALAVSPPLDVEAGAASIERPPLNSLLSLHMARSLRRTVLSHAALRASAVASVEELVRCRTVRQFDAAFTTKHFGFESVGAYYRAATLRDKLHRVRVPLLCLCAADDPFQPLAVLPAAEAEASACVALAVPARGGHIGFVEGAMLQVCPTAQYIARLAHQYFGAILRVHEAHPHQPLLLHQTQTVTAQKGE